MGFSSVAGSAIAAIMLVAGFSILLNSSMDNMTQISESLTDQIKDAELIIGEQCTITRWKLDASNTLRFNVTNTGQTIIQSEDFEKMDVIVYWVRPNHSEVREWVPYIQDTLESETYWKINRVFWNQEQVEAVNPISLTPTLYGVWDPLETLEIELHVQASVHEFDALIFVMPHGYRAQTTTICDENRGTAVCLKSNTFVDVTHYLTNTPTNIQLTCLGDYKGYYYVSNVGATTFRINFSAAQTKNVDVYWVAYCD